MVGTIVVTVDNAIPVGIDQRTEGWIFRTHRNFTYGWIRKTLGWLLRTFGYNLRAHSK
jgi:hypothetical protein